MSDTPKLPDESKRLLDNGWMIVLYKSPLDDYAAVALNAGFESDCRAIMAVRKAVKHVSEDQITSDFEPSQALTRLASKVFGCEVPQ